MRTIIALIAIIVTGCAQSSAQKSPRVQDSHHPSATEVFELQGKCAALVDKLAEREGFSEGPLSVQYKSHYSGWRNRCYVETYTMKNFDFKSSVPYDYVSDVVADAQTHDILVVANQRNEKSYGRDWLMDESLVTFEQALAKIHRLMTEESEERIYFEASDGTLHSVPQSHLVEAEQIDPKLRVLKEDEVERRIR
ncbi:MAG: hypothetical protein ACRD4S_15635 [Candidatus Acidiferrales bacterium]